MNPAPRFTHYVALGDSMSVDDYPGEGKGAASLLYRNQDHLYPDFAGRDLVTTCPGIELVILARDGATTVDIVHDQLTMLGHLDSSNLLFRKRPALPGGGSGRHHLPAESRGGPSFAAISAVRDPAVHHL